jgi:hypothetical protein
MNLQIARAVVASAALAAAMGSQTSPTANSRHTGNFTNTSVKPANICTNIGTPIVFVSFSANSSHTQEVRLLVSDEQVSGLGFGYNIPTLENTGNWSGEASIDLRRRFGTNIPSTITVRGELWDNQAGPGNIFQVATSLKMDSFVATVNATPCSTGVPVR